MSSDIVPRFLITDDLAQAGIIFAAANGNDNLFQKLGHADGQEVDSVLKKSLEKYDIEPPDAPVRISCAESAGLIGDVNSSNFQIEIVSENSTAYEQYAKEIPEIKNAVSINKKIAVLIIDSVYRAAEYLICGNCHIMIDAKDVVLENGQYLIKHTRTGYDDYEEYTMTLLAPPYAGKTALLLSNT